MSLFPGPRRGILFYFVVAICCTRLYPASTNAFEFYDTGNGDGARPTLDRRAMAGLWKLTPLVARQYPMKEFTVYPKKKPPTASADNDDQQLPELLLMLKEDGSFQRYDLDADADIDDDDDLDGNDETMSRVTNKINQSWIKFQQRREQFANICTGGTWDFLDGNLLLAADRIDNTSYHAKADGGVGGGSTLSSSTSSTVPRESSSSSSSHKTDTNASTTDTLLKGRVVAKYQPQLSDNPTAVTRTGDGAVETTGSPSTNSTTTAADRTTGVIDTHLSVPMGTINIGKFFYPKKHPSFFEQPMFRPIQKGSFALRQVLGPLSMQKPKTDAASQTKPAYQRADFYNKTFLLTSSPIPPRPPPAGEQRWSIKYNKYVQDPPKSSLAKKSNDNDDAAQQSANIRVIEVAFYQNNTFCSIAGLGQSAILRGKFDVIGQDKDQIWFQIVRFGFGRSVSGSVYSEGRMLSHEDAKAYWGTIHRMDENDPASRLEVRGSVLLGWGLEPLPVARFIMRETETGGTEQTLEDEEEEEEYEDDDEDKSIETIEKLVQNKDGDDSDWVSPESSFQ